MTHIVELPDNAVTFQTQQDLDDYIEFNKYIIPGRPEKFPCVGWEVFIEYRSKSTQIRRWTFVYPKQTETTSTQDQIATTKNEKNLAWRQAIDATKRDLNKIDELNERLDNVILQLKKDGTIPT